MIDGNARANDAVVIGVIVLLTIVTAVLIWQLGATRRARMAVTREEGYRALAEASVAAEQSADRRLTEIAERLAEMSFRMESLERIL